MTIPSSQFMDLLQGSQPILADGAMGTMLHSRGIEFDQCFDELNLKQPALVADIHREYIEAGAILVKTNTFGANRFKLSRHDLQTQVQDINKMGVDLVRRVINASFRNILIAGDIGPLGVRLSPYGRVQTEQAEEVFQEQISALVSAGVDLILVETMSDLEEVCSAVRASHQVAPHLPIIASTTYTRDDRTLLGDAPDQVARSLFETGVEVIGINCSGGPAQILRILGQMRQAVPGAVFSVMPNAGWPEQVGGRIMYPAHPDYFGEYAQIFWQAGAKIIGGCCGTTPAHIAALRKRIDHPDFTNIQVLDLETNSPGDISPAIQIDRSSRMAQRLSEGKFVVSVEMDPPRGLATQKLIAGASLLAEAGADVIDVADSPMARMRMSPWAVCDMIQRRVGIETVLHFPTRGRNLLRVQGDLLAAYALGVRNIFVVMGDPTSIGDYPDAMDNYDLVPSGLIALIKKNFNIGLDHSGVDIGQPTNFFVGGALNLCPADPAQEIKNLRRKLRAGVDFFLTQPVFDTTTAAAFLKQCTEEIENFHIPVLAGILPLTNARHANFLHNEVPGMQIPEQIRQRIETSGEKSLSTGTEIALELIQQIRPMVQGIYMMPAFNRFDQIAEIIEIVCQG